MRTIVYIILFIVGSIVQAGNPVHVIITAGQSNTDGRVENVYLPSYIKEMATDTIDFSEGKYRFCRIAQNRTDGQFISFWPCCTRPPLNRWAYDAVTYYLLEQKLQQDFYVIKWAVGGTAIASNAKSTNKCWLADSAWLAKNISTVLGGRSLLLSLLQNIDVCIDSTLSQVEQGYRIDAFLWHQGESDKGYGPQYYDNLKAVVSYVRNHLTEKTGKDYSCLPFIFGTVSQYNKSYDSEVKAGMKRLATEDSNVYMIDMSKGELQSDQLHFTEKSAEYLGEQMYLQLAKILD